MIFPPLAVLCAACYAVCMSEKPPRSLSHNWPRYQRSRRDRRPKLIRPLPTSDLEVLAYPEAPRRPAPVCGGKLTPIGDYDAAIDKDRPAHLTCYKPAGHGTDHPGFGPCSGHGGNTRAVRKASALDAGQYFILQRKAEMSMFGGDPDTINLTPEEAILEEVRRSVAMVRYIQQQISSWDPGSGDLGFLPALTDETTRGLSSETDAAGWLRLYRDERAHMVRTSKMAIDVGISLLLVKLAQEQGLRLATAIEEILEALELTPQQAQLVPTVVPEILRKFADMPQAPIDQPMLEGVVIE